VEEGEFERGVRKGDVEEWKGVVEEMESGW
jgi:hypothetical protein